MLESSVCLLLAKSRDFASMLVGSVCLFVCVFVCNRFYLIQFFIQSIHIYRVYSAWLEILRHHSFIDPGQRSRSQRPKMSHFGECGLRGKIEKLFRIRSSFFIEE